LAITRRATPKSHSLGDHVGGILRIRDAPQRIGEDRPPLTAVEPAEANLGKLAVAP